MRSTTAVKDGLAADHLRVSPDQLASLHQLGAVLVPDFFSQEELRRATEDARMLFADVAVQAKGCAVSPAELDIREFPKDRWFDCCDFPFNSEALNLIGCHPAVVSAARAALGSAHVQMHYNYVSAKYAGAKNYSQPLHLDSPMHSFFAPSNNPRYSAVNCVIYLSDVDVGAGPLSYVPLEFTRSIPYGKITLNQFENDALSKHEVLATGSAGSLLIYFHHTYHRGTNLTRAGSSRIQLVASYHSREASPFIGGAPWPRTALTPEWKRFLPHASLEQLEVIGLPPPGHDFWTTSILDELASRIPEWDLGVYREAMRVEHKSSC